MAAVLLMIALALEPQVEAESLDSNRHMLQMKTDTRTTFKTAQAALIPTARRLCSNRSFFLGAFKFADQPEERGANPGAAQAGFQQELYCSSPEQPSAVAAPSEAQQQAVLEVTYGYLAAKDSNRLPDAYAMLSRRAKVAMPEPDWTASARGFNQRAGAVTARRVTDLSWYSDPPDAPEPGLYVAADLNGAFENVEFLCGYVVWRLEADGRYRLVREEQNFLERRAGARLAALDRAPLRAQMGCKD